MTTTRWTQTHTFFPNGSAAKVHTLAGAEGAGLSVVSTSCLTSGATGWTFTYSGLFAEERHDGFRTMAAAKAAAVAYLAAPVSEAQAVLAAHRAL